MATATNKNTFGAEIRKLASELDSGNPPKMDAAVRRIALFCVENGVSFAEAMAAAMTKEENLKYRLEVSFKS